MTNAPVPWSLAWCADGELACQDRFDLLQTLLPNETPEAQPSLVYAIERLHLSDISVVAISDVSSQAF